MKWIVILLLATVATGCTSLVGESLFTGDKGRVLISADKEGMIAFGESLNGLVTNGKANPDSDTSYWHQQRAREVTKRMKFAVVKPANQEKQDAN